MTQPSLLILGARSDIARALAHEYAAQGYGLRLAARNASALEPDAEDLRIRYGTDVSVHEWDACDVQAAQSFYQQFEESPETVISVAGYLGDQTQAQSEWEECERVLYSNFIGLTGLLNKVAEDFANRGSGCIIGISSVAGDRGRQSNYIYGCAKAGFTAYLSGLRNRLYAQGVKVITVKPGFVDTQMTAEMQLPRLLTSSPQQVARRIFKAQRRGHDVIYCGWYWRWIMLIIRSLPEQVFKRLSL